MHGINQVRPSGSVLPAGPAASPCQQGRPQPPLAPAVPVMLMAELPAMLLVEAAASARVPLLTAVMPV